MKAAAALALLAVSVALSACAEKAQTAGQRKADVSPSKGANPAYTAGTWKAGDAGAWDAQIKARAQGQNEYARSAP